MPQPGKITRSAVIENIQRSLNRMNVNSIDLLQFHWWDYNNPYYMDALKYLTNLRDNGMIKNIGLTNFDTERVQIMMDSDLPIVSNQIQYSIIDRRPEVKMIPFCQKHNICLFAYGSLCGGLMSDRYFKREKPTAASIGYIKFAKIPPNNREMGRMGSVSRTTVEFEEIAQKYKVSIANLATRFILDSPAVAGVIIGTRLGIVDHRAGHAQVFNFRLERSDFDAIDAVCKKSNNLFEIIGDCGDGSDDLELSALVTYRWKE